LPRGGDKGIGWVDAPVSGGQAGAENGQLVIMCGGDRPFRRRRAGDRRLFQGDERFGEVGAGS
jgi:3-hydroxyisobutyrate dehydrogenase